MRRLSSEVTATPASQYRAIVESIASTGVRTSVLRMPLVDSGIGRRRYVFDAVVGEHGRNVRAVEQCHADIFGPRHRRRIGRRRRNMVSLAAALAI